MQRSTAHRCLYQSLLITIKKMPKIGKMVVTGILPPTLKMIPKIHYPLPTRQQAPIPPPSDIPLSPSPLPSAEPEWLGDDQIESEEVLSKHKWTMIWQGNTAR